MPTSTANPTHPCHCKILARPGDPPPRISILRGSPLRKNAQRGTQPQHPTPSSIPHPPSPAPNPKPPAPSSNPQHPAPAPQHPAAGPIPTPGACPAAGCAFKRRGGERGGAVVFRSPINLPASHASQLQPGSDLCASEVHQREKYFPGAPYPPHPPLFPLSLSLSGKSSPRPEPARKARSHPSPRVSPPALATQPGHPPSAPRHLRAKENFLWLPRLRDPPKRDH